VLPAVIRNLSEGLSQEGYVVVLQLADNSPSFLDRLLTDTRPALLLTFGSLDVATSAIIARHGTLVISGRGIESPPEPTDISQSAAAARQLMTVLLASLNVRPSPQEM